MNIKELLKESTKDILTDENLQVISEAVEARANELADSKSKLKLEAALAKQDLKFSEKLQTLLEDIDTRYTGMMTQLIEKIEDRHVGMLKNVVRKYKTELVTEGVKFKDTLVDKIDKFFDLVVESNIPVQQLNEAVENTRYKKLVQEISKMIGHSNIQENELIKEGLIDAKNQLDQLNEQVRTLKKKNERLVTEQSRTKAEKLLLEKCSGLPKIKKDYIFRTLGNKSEQFITENFDYILELYDDEDSRNTNRIRKEAQRKSRVIVEGIDRPDDLINEEVEDNSTPHVSGYMEVLSQF